MPKPQWLIDKEMQARRVMPEPDKCGECANFGQLKKRSRDCRKKLVEIYSCDIHPGCENMRDSICCEDFERRKLL